LFLAIACQQKASNASELTARISEDCKTGTDQLNQYKPLYDSTFVLIRTIKITGAAQGEAGIAQAYPLAQEAMTFFLAYDNHQKANTELEALSARLSSGQISFADAQKEYAALHETWKTSGDALPSGEAIYQKVKADFAKAFPNPINRQ
jgi:hypothetical protein